MPQVPAQSFYLGPFAVYTAPTGMTDPITSIPYLGGTLHDGDYVDLTREEAAQWNVRFGAQLDTGRFRLTRLSTLSTAANLGFGIPVGWGRPSSLRQVSIVGTGAVASGANGVYLVSSTTDAASGSFPASTAATALVTVVSAVITSAQLVYPGANMRTTPTFALTEITGYVGGAGPLVALMAITPNLIGSFDTTACAQILDVRGIALTAVTAAQILANAWIVIQEQGIAQVLITTATSTAAGAYLQATTGGAVTSTATQPTSAYFGQAVDIPAASTLIRADLSLPVRQG